MPFPAAAAADEGGGGAGAGAGGGGCTAVDDILFVRNQRRFQAEI